MKFTSLPLPGEITSQMVRQFRDGLHPSLTAQTSYFFSPARMFRAVSMAVIMA